MKFYLKTVTKRQNITGCVSELGLFLIIIACCQIRFRENITLDNSCGIFLHVKKVARKSVNMRVQGASI